MTIRISKEFLLYMTLLLMMTLFGILYMAQSNAIESQQMKMGSQMEMNKETDVRINHSATENGEVLGIVK